ncbi:MAG: response regulator [Planctomycetes bacterium]|nr:response regulator [Planctomycetota bacterium]
MQRWFARCLPLVLAVAPASAQAEAARAARAQQAAAAAGSPAWFDHGCDVVEAELAHDVAAAVAAAAELVAAAPTHGPGEVDIAEQLHRLAVALHEGPARLASTSATPDSAWSDARRARWHTLRARLAWLVDRPTEYLAEVFAGLTAARRTASAPLLLRAAWTLHLAVEREAPTYDETLLAEIDALRAAPGATAFAAWDALNRYWRAGALHTRTERLAALATIVQQADAIGDRRTRIQAEWDRAGIECQAGPTDAAASALASALTTCEQLGDRRLLAVALEQMASLELERQHLDAADELLRRAAAVTAGRGFPDRDIEQDHLRLQLATRRGDTAAVAAATARLEELRQAEARRHRGYETLREQLLSGERQRLDLERGLAQERERGARQLATVRTIAAVGGLVALATLATLALLSRRRLSRAHARLQEQVQRADTEAAARRGAEQRLQQLERADSLGVLASGVAHDFNNLIVGVLGNADLLQSGETDPERRRLLAGIAAAGERGARLCRQLQAQLGDAPTAAAPFDLGALLRELQPVLAAGAGQHVQVEVETGPDALPVLGHATEIEQVALNLVANSRDAGATRIVLRAAAATMTAADWPTAHVFGLRHAGSYVVLEVDDDGEGMRPEQIDRIFDPFFTTRFPGRGLGLAMVAAAMRHHDGTIVVTSAPGQGTRFRIHLPRDAAERAGAAAAAAAATEPATPAPMAVLVVDDEPHVREFLASALQRRGHEAHCLPDGTAIDQALVRFAAAVHPVALVDLTMPGLDGRDVLQRVRAACPRAAVVLMSGHSDVHLAETADQVGADGYVAKPFRADAVVRELTAAMQRRARKASAG